MELSEYPTKEEQVHPDSHKCCDNERTLLCGMSLLDYFAAKALIALGPVAELHKYNDTQIAFYAYELAEAMMKERIRRAEGVEVSE